MDLLGLMAHKCIVLLFLFLHIPFCLRVNVDQADI